ncbi:adenosine deaminase family protein [Aminobacter aminovorans]|jgi:adenosine deaminase|uniref:Adenosine deaminase n=1 Tax=Aminobacter aminovorans TaxID=83263 RepID=A0AAC8YVH0_AMIAI|nr:hypothetical protein [Aminobacter aminovorans]AMS45170.1 hypothetical protein AA2016_6272 [Aminobacter aminovorans]MBB3705072.1 adenosine deaminase [Aminobacter aminovorans]
MFSGELKAFLERIPKTDLHIHLLGSIRPGTLVELAGRRGFPLPGRTQDSLYRYEDFPEFLELLRIASLSLIERDDFARVAYEILEDAQRRNCRHLELFFNPSVSFEQGVAYDTMVDGLIDGLRQARKDYGITCLLIPSIDREKDADTAAQMVELVIGSRRDEVVGIGMDFAEGKGPPQKFIQAYRLAAKAGLKRTAHVCEDNQPLPLAPPGHLRICLEELGCDRVDHGYNLLADPAETILARDRGTHFCITVKTAKKSNLGNRLIAVRLMHDAGLLINIGTDDPYLHDTDLTDSWTRLFHESGWGIRDVRAIALQGVDACWLENEEKKMLRTEVERAIDELILDIWPTVQPGYIA